MGGKRRLTNEEFQERLRQLREQGCDVQYISAKTDMDFYCSKGHHWTAKPPAIYTSKKGGCPYCSNRKVLVGYNDIWTTHPHIASMLKNPEDGYKYTYGMSVHLDFICPKCGSILCRSLNSVSSDGLGCNICREWISYPEKFIRQLLRQLKVSYIPSVTKSIDGFDWVGRYRYDFYFKYQNDKYFIETDGGLGHGNKQIGSKENDIEGLKRDKIKDQLAKEHNIHVIRINCYYSQKNRYEHMKTNIMNSLLGKLFDLSGIDWDLCDKNSQQSLVKKACDLYKSGIRSTVKIGKILELSPATISTYLKRGAKHGWCDYDPILAQIHKKPVLLMNIKKEIISEFECASQCSIYLQDKYGEIFRVDSIQKSCNNGKPYKGFYFKYKD